MLILVRQFSGGRMRNFRNELNVYEITLAQWAKFSMGHCQSAVLPTGIEIERDGRLWLLHEVKITDQAIRCKDGSAVRLLKFGLRERALTLH